MNKSISLQQVTPEQEKRILEDYKKNGWDNIYEIADEIGLSYNDVGTIVQFDGVQTQEFLEKHDERKMLEDPYMMPCDYVSYKYFGQAIAIIADNDRT